MQAEFKKTVVLLGLIVIISPGCATRSPDKAATQVAVYNPDLDAGESLGEKGVLKCLQSEGNFKPEFVTDLSYANLRKYKVLVLPLVRKFGNRAKSIDWRREVTNYVYEGGRVLLTSENTGIKGEVLDTLFPTIMEGSRTVGNKKVNPIPIYSVNTGIEPFDISYGSQIELRRGSKGVVFLRNDRWCNLGIVGDFGKGKVAALGFPLGVASDDREIVPAGQEARMLLNVVRWLAGEQRYEVPNVWIEARKLPPLNKGPSRILDLGEEAGPQRLKAGAASVDITPADAVGKLGLIGLGPRKRRICKGIHDPMMLRALVLSNGRTKVAIVTMDTLMAFGRGYSEKVRKTLKEKIGIPEDNILINCTHTHAGTWPRWDDMYKKTVQAVCEANSRLREARLGVGSKMIYGISANIRRRWHDDYFGLWRWNQPNPDGIMNNECGVIRVEDKDRKLIAVVVNYRGTPSVSGGTRYISGDYAGIAMHDLEKRWGCVAMFTQGFQGNVFTAAFRRERTMKEAERLGRKLADEVASIVPHVDVKNQVQLASARKYVSLPRWKGSYEIETQSMLIGDCLFVLGEPEIYVEIGMRLKEELSGSFPHVFCCGVGKGQAWYLSWRRGYGTDHWVVSARRHGYTMDAEGVLVKSILGLAADVKKAKEQE